MPAQSWRSGTGLSPWLKCRSRTNADIVQSSPRRPALCVHRQTCCHPCRHTDVPLHPRKTTATVSDCCLVLEESRGIWVKRIKGTSLLRFGDFFIYIFYFFVSVLILVVMICLFRYSCIYQLIKKKKKFTNRYELKIHWGK